MKIRHLIGLILICLIVIFIIQNAALVEIRILFWTILMSRVLLMLILLIAGIIIGWLLKGSSGWFKRN